MFASFSHLGLALNTLASEPGPIGYSISRRAGKLRQWVADSLPPAEFHIGAVGKCEGVLITTDAWQKYAVQCAPPQVDTAANVISCTLAVEHVSDSC